MAQNRQCVAETFLGHTYWGILIPGRGSNGALISSFPVDKYFHYTCALHGGTWGALPWPLHTAAADTHQQEKCFLGFVVWIQLVSKGLFYCDRMIQPRLWGRLKRSARAVRAQCNYLGVWP